MELVTIAEIVLHRPQSASGHGFASPSNPRNTKSRVDNGEVETLVEAVLHFAAQCGVDRANLISLRRVSGRLCGAGDQDVIFDLDFNPFGTQCSTPYATCTVRHALKIGDRYFELSEIKGIQST